MFPYHPLHRMLRGFLILSLCLLTVGSFPPSRVRAAITESVTDNPLSFSTGTFTRTELAEAPDPVLPPQYGDQGDGVQLSLLGSPPEWSSFELPRRLIRMGTARLGDRIYVIGGVSDRGNEGEVWSTAINRKKDGRGAQAATQPGAVVVKGWRQEPSLPPAQPTDPPQITQAISPTVSPAVTTVLTDTNGGGYIYVIGGETHPDAQHDYSTRAVRIGKVEPVENTGCPGCITWLESGDVGSGARLTVNKLQSAAATTLTFGEGRNKKTFVYLIGGLERAVDPTGQTTTPHKNVIYAQVNLKTGKLYKPSSNLTEEGWEKQASDIPIPATDGQGLWDTAIVAGDFPGTTAQIGTSGESTSKAIYLIGGQVKADPVTYSVIVYRALVDSNGLLTWDAVANVDTLPEPRGGLAGTEYHGAIYVTGGSPSLTPAAEKTVLATYIEDGLKFSTGNNSTKFPLNVDNGLFEARSQHGGAVMPNADDTSAFIYVIGGQDDQRVMQDTVYVGRIGSSSPTADLVYPATGWYFSTPYAISTGSGRLQSVNWSAQIPNADSGIPGDPDVRIQYRVATQECTNPTITWSDWLPPPAASETVGGLDATATGSGRDGYYSNDGTNSVEVATTDELQQRTDFDRCFQYRAELIRGPNSQAVTPQLLNVNLGLFVTGSPDIRVNKLRPTFSGNPEDGIFTGLEAELLNQYGQTQTDIDKTLAADFDTAGGGGSFFVDLFVISDGEAWFTPTIPFTQTTLISDGIVMKSKVTAEIPRKELGQPDPDPKTYSIPLDSWHNSDEPSEKVDVTKVLFSESGTYRLCLAIDSFVNDLAQSPYGMVNESLPGAEENNFSCTDPFFVSAGAARPTIRITAPDTEAVEATSATGEFLVSSSISSTTALKVFFNIGGEATLDTDYAFSSGVSLNKNATPITGTVTIPAGATSVAFKVQPKKDSTDAEPDEQVVATLQSDSAYSINSEFGSATVRIMEDEPELALSVEEKTFTITRTRAGISRPLTVTFTLEGSARYNVDYTLDGISLTIDPDQNPVSGQIVFPSNTSTLTMTVQAMQRASGEVILVLSDKQAKVLLGSRIYFPLIQKKP